MNTDHPHLPLAAALRARGFVGRLVEPADPGYDEARAGWNGAIDRRPAAVAYASDADDVAAAIRAARRRRAAVHGPRRRPLGLRALGARRRAVHRPARRSTPSRSTPSARSCASAAARCSSELDAATQEHGLAVPGRPDLPHRRRRAHARRRPRLADAPPRPDDRLAAGGRGRARRRRRSCARRADEHPDLFWALRGGGGDFGVVTRFEFRAHRVGPMVLGGMLVYPWEQAREAFRAARALMADAPDALTVFAVLLTAPPQEPFPAELQGRPVAVVARRLERRPRGGRARARAAARRLPAAARPRRRRCPTSRCSRCSTRRRRTAGTTTTGCTTCREVSDGFIDALIDGFERVPDAAVARHDRRGWAARSTACAGGDRVRPPRRAGADLDHRLLGRGAGGARRPTGCAACWRRPRRSRPAASTSTRSTPSRSVRDAYADEVWERLVAVKRRYDPDGVFDGNGIRLEALAHGVRGRLGAAAHAELGEHAADVVLGGLRRDHEPLGDLGVREPGGDQRRAPRARARSARRARRASAVRPATPSSRSRAAARSASPARAEPLERVARGAGAGERERRAGRRLRAREREPRARLLERERERREALDGVLEPPRRRRRVAAAPAAAGRRAAPPRRARSLAGGSPPRSAQRAAAPSAASRSPRRRARPRRAASARRRPRARALRGRAAPAASSSVAAREVQRDERRRARRARPRARRAAVAASSRRPWRSRRSASTASGSARPPPRRRSARPRERLVEHRLGALPVARSGRAPRRRCRGTTTGPA